jgi:hypothetical protein
VMANPKGYKSGDDLGNVKESMDIWPTEDLDISVISI